MAVVVASCTLEKLFSGVPILASDGKVEKDIHGMLAIPEYPVSYTHLTLPTSVTV